MWHRDFLVWEDKLPELAIKPRTAFVVLELGNELEIGLPHLEPFMLHNKDRLAVGDIVMFD